MSRAIPNKLQELVPLEEIIRRIPDNYSRALFSAYLAARFVYKYGLAANDFALFEMVSTLLESSPAQKKKAAKKEEL